MASANRLIVFALPLVVLLSCGQSSETLVPLRPDRPDSPSGTTRLSLESASYQFAGTLGKKGKVLTYVCESPGTRVLTVEPLGVDSSPECEEELRRNLQFHVVRKSKEKKLLLQSRFNVYTDDSGSLTTSPLLRTFQLLPEDKFELTIELSGMRGCPFDGSFFLNWN